MLLNSFNSDDVNIIKENMTSFSGSGSGVSFNINLLEEIDNMEYCKILTREDQAKYSGFFSDAFYTGIYISPDEKYVVLAKIPNKEAVIRIRVYEDNNYKDFVAQMDNYATSSTEKIQYLDKKGGLYIVPVENKEGEFLVRASYYTYITHDSSYHSGYSGNFATIVSLEKIISHVGISTAQTNSGNDFYSRYDVTLSYSPNRLFCYWNATYNKYYFPFCARFSENTTTRYIHYLAPNYFDIKTISGSGYYTDASANFGVISGSSDGMTDTSYGGGTFTKMINDKTIIRYYIYKNSNGYLYAYIYKGTLSAYGTASFNSQASVTISNSTTVSSIAVNIPTDHYYPIWSDNGDIDIYYFAVVKNSSNSYDTKIVKFTAKYNATSLSASNFKVLSPVYYTNSNSYLSDYARILGFVNNDETQPVVFCDFKGTNRYQLFNYYQINNSYKKLVNYYMITPYYSRFGEEKYTKENGWDVSWNGYNGWLWCDLANSRIVQIAPDRLCYVIDASKSDNEITYWTCPEDGNYKIILVGGGAAGQENSGGGSGRLKICSKTYKKGDIIPYNIGAGEPNYIDPNVNGVPDRTTWFDDEFALPGAGIKGGANGWPEALGGGGGGYNLVDYGGNGQLASVVAQKNGGQGLMPAQGYGAGGCAGQNGNDGCIVIIR